MEVMNIYLLYIFLFNFGITSARLQYYIANQSVTAGFASTSCRLASPNFIYSKGVNNVDINVTEIQDPYDLLYTGGPFWIGYVEELVYFLYKGCALPNDLKSTKHENLTEDPGQCYSRCRINIIGIQETTCHCITSLPAEDHLYKSGCNSSCTSPQGVLCGGKDHVSVYMKVQQSTEDLSTNNACLSYNPNENRTFTWQHCLDPLKVVCRPDRNADSFLSWSEAMQQCLDDHSLPTNLSAIPDSEKMLWSTVIRAYSISNIRDNHHIYGLLSGYVELKDRRLQMKFEVPNRNMYKHLLCEMQTKPSPPSSSPAISTGSGTIENIDISSKGNQVALYTAIPLFLVVIAAVLVFILWRRGTLKACKYTDSGICGKTSTTTARSTLESKPQSKAVQHDYFVLERIGEYVSTKENFVHDTNEDNYDKVTRCPNERDTNNDNYDKATRSPNGHDTNEDTYDKTTRFTGNHGTNENNYDTAARFTNDDYDITTNNILKLPRNNISPDAYISLDNLGSYDHIRDIKRAAANSDDCYNHLETNKNENTYDTTSSSVTFTQAIADDTYSKVAEK